MGHVIIDNINTEYDEGKNEIFARKDPAELTLLQDCLLTQADRSVRLYVK